jgi:hypothetical protein
MAVTRAATAVVVLLMATAVCCRAVVVVRLAPMPPGAAINETRAHMARAVCAALGVPCDDHISSHSSILHNARPLPAPAPSVDPVPVLETIAAAVSSTLAAHDAAGGDPCRSPPDTILLFADMDAVFASREDRSWRAECERCTSAAADMARLQHDIVTALVARPASCALVVVADRQWNASRLVLGDSATEDLHADLSWLNAGRTLRANLRAGSGLDRSLQSLALSRVRKPLVMAMMTIIVMMMNNALVCCARAHGYLCDHRVRT